MHPFDFECVAHGMTLSMGFECYFKHVTREQPHYTLELYCELWSVTTKKGKLYCKQVCPQSILFLQHAIRECKYYKLLSNACTYYIYYYYCHCHCHYYILFPKSVGKMIGVW